MLVKEASLPSELQDDFKLNISSMPAGTYFVELDDGKTETLEKLVIIK